MRRSRRGIDLVPPAELGEVVAQPRPLRLPPADADVDGRSCDGRDPDAQELDHEEAGEECAKERAERVDGVETAHR